jgi:hypothetical protein
MSLLETLTPHLPLVRARARRWRALDVEKLRRSGPPTVAISGQSDRVEKPQQPEHHPGASRRPHR